MESWRIMMARRGLAITDEMLQSVIGFSDDLFLRGFFEKNGIEGNIDAWLAEKRDTYFGLIMKGVRAFPGAPGLVQHLSRRMPIAIGTSSARREMQAVAGQLNIAHLLAASVAKEDVAHHKPAPDCYLLAAERMSVAPEDCVVFEDSIVGVAAAKAAGARCIAVTNSFGPDELAGADLIAGSLEDIDAICAFIDEG